MCTGERGYWVCPCRKTACPKKGIVFHPDLTSGHVCHIEVDTLSWQICDWWIVNGPPEQVLNRYLKPTCAFFAWYTLLVPVGICDDCKVTCQAKKWERGGEGSGNMIQSTYLSHWREKGWWLFVSLRPRVTDFQLSRRSRINLLNKSTSVI